MVRFGCKRCEYTIHYLCEFNQIAQQRTRKSVYARFEVVLPHSSRCSSLSYSPLIIWRIHFVLYAHIIESCIDMNTRNYSQVLNQCMVLDKFHGLGMIHTEWQIRSHAFRRIPGLGDLHRLQNTEFYTKHFRHNDLPCSQCFLLFIGLCGS